MRILHVCLANFYIDNYGYQENILPRMHKRQGHEVMILASTETYVDKIHLGYVKPCKYINEDNIPVHRIPYCKWLPIKLASKLRYYEHIYSEIEGFEPDFIFLHNAQFMSIGQVIRYLKKHPCVRVNVDSHTDSINSARNYISKHILHRIIYRYCMQRISPYVSKFFGTLPNRMCFLKEMYGISPEKISLLVMGADDDAVVLAQKTNQRQIIRQKFNIPESAFLLVSGGKFTQGKKDILQVMDVVASLHHNFDIRLLVFGSVSDEGEFRKTFFEKCDDSIVQYAGWINSAEVYNYFEAADLIIFPGLHSVLWEQAVGQGKPCIFKYIAGQTHTDLGGNCLFVHSGTCEEFKNIILEAIHNYPEMLKVARDKGLKEFSYYEIAKRAIESNDKNNTINE